MRMIEYIDYYYSHKLFNTGYSILKRTTLKEFVCRKQKETETVRDRRMHFISTKHRWKSKLPLNLS